MGGSLVSVYCLFMAPPHVEEELFGDSVLKAHQAMQIAGYVAAGVTLVLFVLLCCIRKSVDQAVTCIEASCEALWSLPAMRLMPVLEIGVKVLFVIVWLVLFAWVVSDGEIEAPAARVHGTPVRGLIKRFGYTREQKWRIGLQIIALLWGLETMTAFFQFIMGYAVVVWYFTPSRKVPISVWDRGLCHALRYHIGTLALSGAVMGLFRFPHTVLNFITKQAKSESNPAASVCAHACMCGIWCFEEIVKYINKNAIIEVILNSTPFFSSAGNAIRRVSDTTHEAAALCGVTSVFQSLGIVSITTIGAYLAFFCATHLSMYTSRESEWFLESPAAVVVVATILSFIVSSAFMFTIDMTSDTMLFCWLADTEDTHVDFTPERLRELLGSPKRGAGAGGSGGFDRLG